MKEKEKSWGVYFEEESEDLEEGWYAYWGYEPYGPFNTEEAADEMMDRFEENYDRRE